MKPVEWTILSDNRINKHQLISEHGLSVLLKTERFKILLDTGAGEVFIKNAKKLSIDLTDIDYVFISHGHIDHAGGLPFFMRINKKAPIIVSSNAVNGYYFSNRNSIHDLTPQWPIDERNRFVFVDHTCEVLPGLHVISGFSKTYSMPKGNCNLFYKNTKGQIVHDDFRHEMALYTDGFFFTGCAHSGLENMLKACAWPLDSVVGGFHLLDGYESQTELKDLAKRLLINYPHTTFYTGHCTGDDVFDIMKSVMGDHLQEF